jgi:hypothetical protein
MSMSGSAPQPANPGDVAGLQQQQNQTAGTQSQAGSMVNQNNPYGSLNYVTQKDPSGKPITGPGGIPLYTANVTMSPIEQQLFNILTGTQTAAGTAGQKLISGAGYGDKSPTDVIGDKTSGLTGQLLSGYTQAMQPFFTTQQQQLDTQLRNQGLFPGSPAYDNSMRSLQTNVANAVAGATSQFEPQAFNQASQLYQMPASIGGALAALGQPQTPNSSLVQTPQLNINPPDVIGAYANAENEALQAQQNNAAQTTSLINTLMSPINAALGGWARGPAPGGK